MLVSKAIVEGHGEEGGRYTLAQRHRLLREGVREFFRLGGRPIETDGRLRRLHLRQGEGAARHASTR